MKVRLSDVPFWTYFCLFFFAFCGIILVPVVNLVDVLIGGAQFKEVKDNIIGGAVFLLISIITFVVLYAIWRHKYPEFLILSKQKGMIVRKKKIIYIFQLNQIQLKPNYPPFKDFIEPTEILLGFTRIDFF